MQSPFFIVLAVDWMFYCVQLKVSSFCNTDILGQFNKMHWNALKCNEMLWNENECNEIERKEMDVRCCNSIVWSFLIYKGPTGPLLYCLQEIPCHMMKKTIQAIKLWWWVLTEIGVAYVFGNLIARLRLREMAKLLIQHSLELKKHHLDDSSSSSSSSS